MQIFFWQTILQLTALSVNLHQCSTQSPLSNWQLAFLLLSWDTQSRSFPFSWFCSNNVDCAQTVLRPDMSMLWLDPVRLLLPQIISYSVIIFVALLVLWKSAPSHLVCLTYSCYNFTETLVKSLITVNWSYSPSSPSSFLQHCPVLFGWFWSRSSPVRRVRECLGQIFSFFSVTTVPPFLLKHTQTHMHKHTYCHFNHYRVWLWYTPCHWHY